MSCRHDNSTDDCVCSTLLAIAEAQDKIEDNHNAGCRQSIDELKGRIKIKGFDTIPVLLTIEGVPFRAVGATRNHKGDRQFSITKSFLFRVNDVDRNTCCATLELLKPVDYGSDYYEDSSSSSSSSKRSNHSSSSYDHSDSEFNDFIQLLENSKKVVRTDVFVTVDLKQFTSVSCFPAVHTC